MDSEAVLQSVYSDDSTRGDFSKAVFGMSHLAYYCRDGIAREEIWERGTRIVRSLVSVHSRLYDSRLGLRNYAEHRSEPVVCGRRVEASYHALVCTVLHEVLRQLTETCGWLDTRLYYSKESLGRIALRESNVSCDSFVDALEQVYCDGDDLRGLTDNRSWVLAQLTMESAKIQSASGMGHCPSDSLSPVPFGQGFLSPREIATAAGFARFEAFDKAVTRWRLKHRDLAGRDWVEIERVDQKSPQFLYRAEALKQLIDKYTDS